MNTILFAKISSTVVAARFHAFEFLLVSTQQLRNTGWAQWFRLFRRSNPLIKCGTLFMARRTSGRLRGKQLSRRCVIFFESN
jgi:hypothetical protein